MRKPGASSQSQTFQSDCGHPWPVVSATGVSEIFNLQPLEWEWCVSRKRAAEGRGMSEVNEGLSAGAWIGTMGHSPRARCQLLGTSVRTCPKPGVRGVCMSIHWQTPSLEQGAREQEAQGQGRGIRQVGDPCWYLGGPMSLGYLWDNCVSAVYVQQAPRWASGSGTRGAGKGGPGSRQGCWASIGVVLVLYGCACSCEPGECVVCPALVTFCL